MQALCTVCLFLAILIGNEIIYESGSIGTMYWLMIEMMFMLQIIQGLPYCRYICNVKCQQNSINSSKIKECLYCTCCM